jgi:hypothetical protein
VNTDVTVTVTRSVADALIRAGGVEVPRGFDPQGGPRVEAALRRALVEIAEQGEREEAR